LSSYGGRDAGTNGDRRKKQHEDTTVSHRTTRPRRAPLGLLAIVTALVLAGCGGEGGEGGDGGDATTATPDAAATATAGTGADVDLVNAGQLTVCTHLPYEPFEFRQENEIVGFDIDLMDLLAEDLGVETAVVDTPFEGIQSGEDLNSGRCDIAAAGMTITEDRAEVIAFSDPYFDATQALITQEGAPYETLDDLEGETLGVQSGTTGEIYAEENAPEGVTLRSYEDLALLLSAVQTEQVAAGINDNGVLYDFVQDNPDLAVVTEFDTGEQYGFGLEQTGSEELIEATNAMIETARSEGTYDEIYEDWFGAAPSSQ
jgi:polar amino acid transport system substrate-binding protein